MSLLTVYTPGFNADEDPIRELWQFTGFFLTLIPYPGNGG